MAKQEHTHSHTHTRSWQTKRVQLKNAFTIVLQFVAFICSLHCCCCCSCCTPCCCSCVASCSQFFFFLHFGILCCHCFVTSTKKNKQQKWRIAKKMREKQYWRTACGAGHAKRGAGRGGEGKRERGWGLELGRGRGRDRGKAGQGPLPGEATWQCLQHNLNNSDAICHTSYGIPCHTTGHTLSYHVPFYTGKSQTGKSQRRLANHSAAQLKGSNSHSNFAISAGSTCLTFFTSFSLTTPQSCPLHHPLSSLL